MTHRFTAVARATLVLLVLALFAPFAASVYAFTDGQAASLVLGQTTFTTSSFDVTDSSMSRPTSVALDPTSGKVFVADAFNNRVLRFASAATLANGADAEAVLGQLSFTGSNSAITSSGMRTPSGVAVDSAGRLWVADMDNNRVLRFDNAATLANGAAANGVLGQPNFTTDTASTAGNRTNGPKGVAVDSAGRLWVADTFNHRVLRFDNAATLGNGAAANGVLGQANFTTSSSGTTASSIFRPSAVAVDNTGRLWVADTDNNRVLRFDNAATLANGAAANGVLGQANFTTATQATTASGMNTPRGVVVDSSGRLWVVDAAHSRVLRFDNAATLANGAAANGVLGQANLTTAAQATTASAMRIPDGVTVDSAGRLWVADSVNNRVLRFDKMPQTLMFGTLAAKTFGDVPFTLSATASSGLPVTFTSSTPTVCTVSGSTVTLVATGSCTIAADQAGNNDYDPAPQVTQSFTVNKATQTITFAALGDKTLGDAPFTLSATASSNLAVTFTSATPAVCTVSGTTVTLVAAGTCTITTAQAGDSNYEAAPQVTRSFTIKGTQTITFGALANKTVGDAPFTLSATATSGLPVSFTSTTPSVCTLNDSTVTLVAAGTCTVAAAQAGNASFSAATPVTQSFTVNPVSSGTQTQTITFASLANKTVGDAPFSVSATASSGLAVTFTSTTPSVCTLSGSTVTLVAAGSCTITASQAGNSSFSAATPVTQSFTVNPATTTLSPRVYLPVAMR